jgi:hypothetical protein
MTIIETCNINGYLNEITNYLGNFQISPNQKQTRFTSYLDSLYSYPSKVKIKWDALDEFTNDRLIEENSNKLDDSFPFLDFMEDWFLNTTSQKLVSKDYSVQQYINGYLDKVHSTNFYSKQTKPIQQALEQVSVFVILNGNGEIILSKPSNDLAQKNLKSFLNEKVYDFCGAFDSSVEKRQQLGLFFMSRLDAEMYLKAAAQSDIDGTQTVGLSINCIGLDAAYKITREYHPGVDFRFVPDLNEVQDFLATHVSKPDIVVEEEQQQLNFRPRSTNVFPYLEKIGFRLSQTIGTRSLSQNNDYFKGVPIYIVQVKNTPRNILKEQYYNVVGTMDTVLGKIIQPLEYVVGLGGNNTVQGSLENESTSGESVNYVFFEKMQASKFVQQQGRNVARYNGARISDLDFLIRKPKIFVYNLEDFIESWEDTFTVEAKNSQKTSTIFQAQKTYFVSPTKTTEEILQFKQTYKSKPLNNMLQALGLKARVLKRNIGIFISVD